MRNARERGLLGVAAGTGMLGAARSRPVPQHTFHGDAPAAHPSRSLAQQAFALHASFPEVHADLSSQAPRLARDDHADAAQPLLQRQNHLPHGEYPKVRVLAPTLDTRPGESIPHLFSSGNLCLHLEDEWSPDMLIVHTTVPWTSEWVLNYELWLATGSWCGGGVWPPPRQANPIPTSNMARAERRRASRRPRR